MLSRNSTQFKNTILKTSFVVWLLFPISYKNWKTRIARSVLLGLLPSFVWCLLPIWKCCMSHIHGIKWKWATNILFDNFEGEEEKIYDIIWNLKKQPVFAMSAAVFRYCPQVIISHLFSALTPPRWRGQGLINPMKYRSKERISVGRDSQDGEVRHSTDPLSSKTTKLVKITKKQSSL